MNLRRLMNSMLCLGRTPASSGTLGCLLRRAFVQWLGIRGAEL